MTDTAFPDSESPDRLPNSSRDFIVVGVGASAGGLEALEQMFDDMPDDLGYAYVIIQHLSPDFKSMMGELLSRHTTMKIHVVEDGIEVQPNSLYMIPPNRKMIISQGKLLLTERESTDSLSLPIDNFFKSLARDSHTRSVAIVLSGTGSDGSRGIQAIHDSGGLVIVQAPESAKFDGMPGNAIETQVVDAVVTPHEIADVLQKYQQHRDREAIRKEVSPVEVTSMERIFRALEQRHHIDFNHYKPATIGRRVKRRIELDGAIGNLDDYAELLERDSGELDQLYRDLLIGVTRFFRDTEHFKTIKEDVLPGLLDSLQPGDEFRAWVAACATGEEAYSIAILLDECLRELNLQVEVKIFATDLHKASILTANAGIYPEESLSEITPERRERHFAKVEGGYQISPDIRKMVVFAPHNLVKDPPFTRLSLVTCRNFLIYLLPESQQSVIALFHFGLRAGGIMFLGSSENPGALSDEFDVIHERHRVFRKSRDVRLGTTFPGSFRPHPLIDQKVPKANSAKRNGSSEKNSTYERLLDQFMPPSFLVDDRNRIVQVFGGAGKYLCVGDGQMSSNLLGMLESELKLAIGGAIQRCKKTREPVCYDRLQIKRAEQLEHVKLSVTPMSEEEAPEKYLISLEPLSAPSETPDGAVHAQLLELDDISRAQLSNLENELQHTKENLQTSIEEMETSNEELQATNEEMVASNEELQSTNEELHSVNEELFTVNSEHQRKISELTELTNDFENLLASTEVHTLFLDESLCIRKFTPKIADVFHLVPHDIGRRIDAFVHSISCERLSEKVEKVLKTGESWEEHVHDSRQQQQFLMRVLPYRSNNDSNGVVLTLIDISSLVSAQEAVVSERERFERAILANRDGTWDWPDLSTETMWWSPTCYRLLGYEPDEFPATYSEWISLTHPDDKAKILETTVPNQKKCFIELHREFEYRMKHKSGDYRWFCHRAIIDHNEIGVAIRMTGSVADIQDRKQAELVAKEGIVQRDNFLSMLSHELRNPMGAVLNAIDSFESQHDKMPMSCPAELSVVRRQTKHMARLLDDLLDVARLGRGRIEFRKEVVDLCQLANAAIESVSYEIQSKRQSIRTSIPSGQVCVFGDSARLKQAQINLLVNASKFSERGQDIQFAIGTENGEAVITITDEGAGIPEEVLDSIFDLFIQSEITLERSAGGMGVGLSLARSIVEAHEGRISAASDGADRGSTFQIRLPTTEILMEPKPRVIAAKRKMMPGAKVLLVDDNVDATQMLAKSLRLRGLEIEAAEDGKQALKQIADFLPLVAVIDIGLPEMNGYEVAEAIRKHSVWDRTLLIALTGYGQESDRRAVLASGFDHHLVKPLQFNRLIELIAAHVEESCD